MRVHYQFCEFSLVGTLKRSPIQYATMYKHILNQLYSQSNIFIGTSLTGVIVMRTES